MSIRESSRYALAAALVAALTASIASIQAQSGSFAAKAAPRIDAVRISMARDTGYNEVVIGFTAAAACGGSLRLRLRAAGRRRTRRRSRRRRTGRPVAPALQAGVPGQVKTLDANQVKEDSILRCQPPGVPRIGLPAKIVQTRREVIFFYDDVNGGFFRIIPIDGRPHRKDLPRSYLGDAIGRWDGDTLVVETVNFNEDTWLTDDGAFHTRISGGPSGCGGPATRSSGWQRRTIPRC